MSHIEDCKLCTCYKQHFQGLAVIVALSTGIYEHFSNITY